MTPNPRDRNDRDIEPDIEQAFRRLMDSADDLETARLRAERLDVHALFSEPTVVTEEFMAMLAGSQNASPELRVFAERVYAGECRWSEIELRARPLPPEVAELKASTNFFWEWTAPPPRPATAPDDDDDYEPPTSWLS